ncbi:methyltransferase C-terminal domain-containing protein [Silvimonas sp. JCM 19000]
MKCRHCAHELELDLVDLGFSPPSNAYLTQAQLSEPEIHYPLRVKVCQHCWLVQTEDFARHDLLFSSDYAYFSSTSSSWLAHADAYVAKMVERLGLTTQSHVVEVAANDGYLLRYVQARGIPCLGVEPTASTAAAARKLGLNIEEVFFGSETARRLREQYGAADLMVSNNVLAHVPDINDFVQGFKILLAEHGTWTIEFPHLFNLLRHSQFDTIYHEHFSYLSLLAVEHVLGAAGLRAYDVEALPTHGGSLRIYACHAHAAFAETEALIAMRAEEEEAGLNTAAAYADFQAHVKRVRTDFVQFLLDCQREGRTVAAYGAAAKGNTLLNYAGVNKEWLPLVADAAASKQGKFLPGSHIPIVSPEALLATKPDTVIILPWNLQAEVMQQLAIIREWGGRFVVAIPEVRVL